MCGVLYSSVFCLSVFPPVLEGDQGTEDEDCLQRLSATDPSEPRGG